MPIFNFTKTVFGLYNYLVVTIKLNKYDALQEPTTRNIVDCKYSNY